MSFALPGVKTASTSFNHVTILTGSEGLGYLISSLGLTPSLCSETFCHGGSALKEPKRSSDVISRMNGDGKAGHDGRLELDPLYPIKCRPVRDGRAVMHVAA